MNILMMMCGLSGEPEGKRGECFSANMLTFQDVDNGAKLPVSLEPTLNSTPALQDNRSKVRTLPPTLNKEMNETEAARRGTW